MSSTNSTSSTPQEPLLIRPGRPDEDAEFVAHHVRDMAANHDGMLQFCSMQAADHRQALQSGLARLLVAEVAFEDGSRPAGFALYTSSHSDRHDRPGLYLQAIYVCQGHRGLQVGKSLLIALARQAVATGCGHLKLIVQGDNSAVDWYRRLGFQVLTEAEDVAFFEVIDEDFVAGFAAAGLQPLPDGISLRLRPSDGDAGDGRRFELTCSACDCRLRGAAALTYCMWQGPVLQMDMSAVRPACDSASECGAVSSSSLACLIGRLIDSVAPIAEQQQQPRCLWVEAVRGGPKSGGLDNLLIRSGFEDNSTNEHWLICLLDGKPLDQLASLPLACRLHPDLTDCWALGVRTGV